MKTLLDIDNTTGVQLSPTAADAFCELFYWRNISIPLPFQASDRCGYDHDAANYPLVFKLLTE